MYGELSMKPKFRKLSVSDGMAIFASHTKLAISLVDQIKYIMAQY